MQWLRGCIAGNDKIRVVAEPLEPSVPDISVNIIVGAWGQPQKCNLPQSSQGEPNEDNSPRQSPRTEKLTDRKEVHDACNGQRRHEVRSAPVAEIARANR